MEFFVFPLGEVVFYPSTSKPMNIFEPRYLQMVQDSLTSGTPIALAYVDEPEHEITYQFNQELKSVRAIAGFGQPMVLERRTDGSQLIFLQGKGKVRLGKVLDRGTPYIVCEGDVISENHLLQSHGALELMTINKVLVHWIHKNVPEAQNREQFLRNIRSAEEVIGCFASYLVADKDMQQLILEADDINEKVQLVSGLISSGELISDSR
jgi:Lon protease-like protein